MQGAILRKKSGIDGITAESFEGDAVLVFTTDGLFTKGEYYSEQGVFYKRTDADRLSFYMTAAEILNKWLYEAFGREEFIRIQNDFLLKAGDKR